jgi:ketosteroid isomerase-like protein
MSRENVELVLGLQPAPDVDLARRFRDDSMWAATLEASGPIFHPDFEFTLPLFGTSETHLGGEGQRAAYLDWLAPWATYRVEIEEAIDLGDRVLLLNRGFGRHEGSQAEFENASAALWTVRDGKIARAEFYADRAEALKAVGLAE